MTPEQIIQAVTIDPPRFNSSVVSQWRKLVRCRCSSCDQLESWFSCFESIRIIYIPHVDSLINLADSERDDCLDWLQMLMRRVSDAIQTSDIDHRSRWQLEQQHAEQRNHVDCRRLDLWFRNSLAITVGQPIADRAVALWGKAFNLDEYMAAFDDYSGLPFDRRMRCRVSLAASDFYLEHHAEIAKWGRE